MARKRKTRKYKLGKRLEKAYANYSARYDKKEAELRKQGLEMLAPKMTPSAYGMVRNAYIEKGQTTNINQTIVRDQAYAYSYKTAKRIKKALDKYDSENTTKRRVAHVDSYHLHRWYNRNEERRNYGCVGSVRF